MRGLYPIVDVDTLAARHIPVIGFAQQVLTARPEILQLRAKHAPPREIVELARRLSGPCAAARTRLFVNDRPDLALVAACDGVHVGQEDLEIADVRRIAPWLQIGVSTHNLSQLDAALAQAPDYVAFGPVFATSSKDRPAPTVGLRLLAAAIGHAEAKACPIVAIGGIDEERAAAVGALGAAGAVISALIPPEGLPGVAARARLLQESLGGAR